MKLVTLKRSDATRLAELETMLFPGDSPWPRDVFVADIASPTTTYVGVIDPDAPAEDPGNAECLEGLVVGYAALSMVGPRVDPEFEIHTIGVDPGYQRRGIARMMLDQLMAAADDHDGPVFLEVRTDNAPAIALYESYGFVQLGVRKNYYQPSGADAYTMMRPSASERAANEKGDTR